nr:hypothetical protein [Tanacetum cinerariifolium]
MHSLQSPTCPYPLIQMDHHEVHLLSLAYVPDPIELDEHVPVHVLKPEHLEYHAPSDDDIQVEDDDEDLEEDPSKEHGPEDDDEDPAEDPNEENEPEDEVLRTPLRILMRLNHSRRTRLLSHHHHLDTVERGYLLNLRHPWPLLPRH